MRLVNQRDQSDSISQKEPGGKEAAHRINRSHSVFIWSSITFLPREKTCSLRYPVSINPLLLASPPECLRLFEVDTVTHSA